MGGNVLFCLIEIGVRFRWNKVETNILQVLGFTYFLEDNYGIKYTI